MSRIATTLQRTTLQRTTLAWTLAAATCCTLLASSPALAVEPVKAVEQMLAAAQQDKRGVTLYVGGQIVAGAVVRVEAGQWVELRSQQFGRIVVRLDRIDAAAMP